MREGGVWFEGLKGGVEGWRGNFFSRRRRKDIACRGELREGLFQSMVGQNQSLNSRARQVITSYLLQSITHQLHDYLEQMLSVVSYRNVSYHPI